MRSSRRRIVVSEGSPFEIESSVQTNYSTFAFAKSHSSEEQQWASEKAPVAHIKSVLTALSVAILGVLFLTEYSAKPDQQDLSIPVDVWERNHNYDPKGNQRVAAPRISNLLIVQLSNRQSHLWSDAASKPNRAYARRWGYDYLLHYSDRAPCDQQSQLLWNIYENQLREELPLLARYDSMLFLSADAIITDMDFNVALLLPVENLVTMSSNEKMCMVNIHHEQFTTLAQIFLKSCDLEASAGSLEGSITVLDPSDTGFIEPRLVKFLVDEKVSDVATLHTTADSVCYRYYPRCDIVS